MTDKVTDISNIQNLIAFANYFNHKKEKHKFIDATDLLHFCEIHSADPKNIHNFLNDLISNLGLDLRNFKVFASLCEKCPKKDTFLFIGGHY